MKINNIFKISLSFLLLFSLVPSSWAWRGGGFRGGWGGRGGGWGGIYIGAGPWYPPYYPDYYAASPYPYYPYAAPTDYAPYPYTNEAPPVDEQPQTDENVAAPQGAHRDLNSIENQIAAARGQVENDYSDGDISASQRNAQLNRLSKILREARDDAASNGDSNAGYLTGQQEQTLQDELNGRNHRVQSQPRMAQEPDRAPATRTTSGNSRRDLRAVSDYNSELTTLLDQKLKDGDITKAQRDGEMKHLNQLDKQAREDFDTNQGYLTADQENTLIQKYQRAYYLINHNLVSN